MSQDNHTGGPNNRPQKPMFDIEKQGGAPARPSGRQVHRASRGVPRLDEPLNIDDMPRRAPSGKGGGRRPSGSVHMSAGTAKRKRRKKIQKRVAMIAVLLVVVLLAGTVVWAYNWIKDQMIDPSEAFTGSEVDQMGTDAIPEYNGKSIVGGLVCGIDYNNEAADGYDDDDHIGNTDMILYVMFDMDNMKLNIMQIPRDMYVGEDVNAGLYKKINGVYRAAEDGTKRMAALAKVINDQFKLPIDFYLKLDLDAMKALVDHKGSIEVYVPQDIVDANNPNNVLLEGWRHLTGDEVEFLVRNRNYPDGDVTRLRMQQSFYSALFREFKTLAPGDLVMWMKILLYYVDVGGLSVMDVGGIAQKLLSINGADVTFVRPPYGGTSNPRGDGQDYVYLIPEGTAEVLNEYFRPDGVEIPAEDLNIHTFPNATYGEGPAEIKTMGEIQSTEPAMSDAA